MLFGLALDRLVAATAPSDQERQLEDLGERATAAIARASPRSLTSGLPPVANDVAEGTEPFVAILSADRDVLYASARLRGTAEALPAALLVEANRKGDAAGTIRTSGGTVFRVHVRPWSRADLGRSGLVVTGQTARFAENQVSDFRVFYLIAGVLALLVAGLATWVVSGRALRPLRRLAATADEIGRTGDLGRRLPERRVRDVMGLLTRSFNGMLDRLAGSQQGLEDALEAQRRFVADASHELRNPLTTIRSNAGFLLERPDAADRDRSEALADIVAEGERMSRLVDDLLTLARADAGRAHEPVDVDLSWLVRDVAAGARRGGRPVHLEISGAVVARGDQEAYRRLVAILLDNAVRHGGGEIEVVLARDGQRAVLSVADRGPGIPEPDLERVFDRFYQADPARGHHGAGLGLAIARSIVEAHGGSIRAANCDSGGAVLIAELPLAPAVT